MQRTTLTQAPVLTTTGLPHTPKLGPSRMIIAAEDTRGLLVEPTHNGRGSLGADGKEPAWFLRGLKPVRIPLEPPPPPPHGLFEMNTAFQSWRGTLFKLRGATRPGIPYDSNWRKWVWHALEDPAQPVLPIPSIRSRKSGDENICLYFHWPGYSLGMTYKFQAYCSRDGQNLVITRASLLYKVFSQLEDFCGRRILDDDSQEAARHYNQQAARGSRSWQVAPMSPQAQKEGRITPDCLWFIGVRYCFDNIFMVELMFAEQNMPPRFGRPYYSQKFVGTNTGSTVPKQLDYADEKDRSDAEMEDLSPAP
ncbi:hypothetical protein DAEQUDRAFT_808184 [Daedalea quercina L-15889]|uniref:Uncharacterized protein n=1 Tax=Daedalea quercina L-15889 TaxID=1314783 RepID=A0A165TJ02_9APHY|nr:hypothetical protein DAEQUDRAFT_808184 [Daedalea quercina L-15889]